MPDGATVYLVGKQTLAWVRIPSTLFFLMALFGSILLGIALVATSHNLEIDLVPIFESTTCYSSKLRGVLTFMDQSRAELETDP